MYANKSWELFIQQSMTRFWTWLFGATMESLARAPYELHWLVEVHSRRWVGMPTEFLAKGKVWVPPTICWVNLLT